MDLRWLLERQIAWIAQADSKLAVLGPLPLAMLAISWTSNTLGTDRSGLVDFSLVSSTGLLCICLFFIKSALSPRLDGPTHSDIYFGKIACRSDQEFIDSVDQLDEGSFRNDLLMQIHANARIAEAKHRNIGRAIISLALATPFWLVSLIGS